MCSHCVPGAIPITTLLYIRFIFDDLYSLEYGFIDFPTYGLLVGSTFYLGESQQKLVFGQHSFPEGISECGGEGDCGRVVASVFVVVVLIMLVGVSSCYNS